MEVLSPTWSPRRPRRGPARARRRRRRARPESRSAVVTVTWHRVFEQAIDAVDPHGLVHRRRHAQREHHRRLARPTVAGAPRSATARSSVVRSRGPVPPDRGGCRRRGRVGGCQGRGRVGCRRRGRLRWSSSWCRRPRWSSWWAPEPSWWSSAAAPWLSSSAAGPLSSSWSGCRWQRRRGARRLGRRRLAPSRRPSRPTGDAARAEVLQERVVRVRVLRRAQRHRLTVE